jgi:MFS family permease
MTLLVSLVLLAFLVGLVVLGMLVNMYFYLSGAFKKRALRKEKERRLGTVVPQSVAEEQFTMGAPASDEVMGNYVRRLVLISVCVLIALALIIAFIVSTIQ